MENKKEKAALNDVLMDKVSGGSCREVRVVLGAPTCKCTGEDVEMIVVRSDMTGRIISYQCPRCGATDTVYE